MAFDEMLAARVRNVLPIGNANLDARMVSDDTFTVPNQPVRPDVLLDGATPRHTQDSRANP